MAKKPDELRELIAQAAAREQSFREQSRAAHSDGNLAQGDTLFMRALRWSVIAQDYRDQLADMEGATQNRTPPSPHEPLAHQMS